MNLKQFNPMKVLNHWQTLNAIVEGRNPPPIACEIDPSNLCNHDCIWCINEGFRKKKPQVLERDLMCRIIKELAEFGVRAVTFTGGGEPLTNPATIAGLYEITKNGMEAALVTNGALIDEEKCRAIVQTCQFVRISLDAGSDEIYQQFHRPKNPSTDSYSRVIENLKILVETRKQLGKSLQIGTAFLVHPLNYHQIFDTARLVRELGVDYIQIRPVFMPGIQLSGRVGFETEQQIQKALTLLNSSFHVFPIMHRFEELLRVEKGYNRCLGHAVLTIIGADGRVYLCCQFRGEEGYCFGSLHEKGFSEIWNGRDRQEAISKIDINKCPPCRYNKYNELLDYLADKERPHKNFL